MSTSSVVTRMISLPSAVTVEGCTPVSSTAVRAWSIVQDVEDTWYSAPPVNSMPRFSPRVASESNEMSTSTAEIAYQRRRLPTMS